MDEDFGFADTRVESLIIWDKLNKSKNEVNDFNKLHARHIGVEISKHIAFHVNKVRTSQAYRFE